MKRCRRVLAGLGAALGTFAGAAVLPAVSPPAGLTFKPVPRSLLVSAAAPAHGIAQVLDGTARTTVLARLPDGAAAVPVAVIVRRAAGTQVSVRWVPSAQRPGLDVLTLEHLYAVALREEPTARYCLTRAPRACDPATTGASHARLLERLAQARHAAMAHAGSWRTGAVWQTIAMTPGAMTGGDPDEVAVRIIGPLRQPLPGITVYFNRAPHLGCGGTSGPDGQARCRLVDHHGEDGDHDDQAAPVVATFPGDVQPGRVLLPTTFVLPARSP